MRALQHAAALCAGMLTCQPGPLAYLMSGLRANSGLSNWLGGVNINVLVVSWPPRCRSGESMVWFLVSLQEVCWASTHNSGWTLGLVVHWVQPRLLMCLATFGISGTLAWGRGKGNGSAPSQH